MDCHNRRMPRRRAGVAVLLGLAAMLALPFGGCSPVLAAPAATELLGTMPGADEARDRSPEVARAVFTTPVDPGDPAIEVHDADGQRVDEGNAGEGASPAVIEVSLPETLPAGEYRATWRAATPEGEPLEGSWAFTIVDDPEGSGRAGPVTLAVIVLLLAGGAVWLARRHAADR